MIGVFDSGVGGLSVLRTLRAQLPGEDFTYIADAAHAPYGERDAAYVASRSMAIADELVARHGARLLVVACNTATAAAIHLLREAHPGVPIVGIEPALKPASLATRNGQVGVMATRGTLASAKFRALLAGLEGRGTQFHLQPCDGLAHAIETADEPRVAALCDEYLGAIRERAGIDTLVLGCTHYPFALHVLQQMAGPGVALVEPGEPVARRVASLMDPQQRAGERLREGAVTLLSTGDAAPLRAFAARFLG